MIWQIRVRVVVNVAAVILAGSVLLGNCSTPQPPWGPPSLLLAMGSSNLDVAFLARPAGLVNVA